MLNKSHFHLPRCSKFGPRLLHDLCQELDGNGQHAMPWHIMPCHAHHYLTYYTMPWRAMPWNPCIYIYGCVDFVSVKAKQRRLPIK